MICGNTGTVSLLTLTLDLLCLRTYFHSRLTMILLCHWTNIVNRLSLMLDLHWHWTYFDTSTLMLNLLWFWRWTFINTGLTLTLDLLWYWTLRNGRPVLWLWRKLTCPGSVNLSRHPPIANSGHQNLRETESKLLTLNEWIRGQDLQILNMSNFHYIVNIYF